MKEMNMLLMNANVSLIIIGVCFAGLIMASCLVMGYMAWKTLMLGDSYLQGKGEPDAEDLTFSMFCRCVFWEPVAGVSAALSR